MRSRRGIIGIVIAAVILIAGMPFSAMADDNGLSFETPQGTAQVWVDVESKNASQAGIAGTFDGAQLEFKASPSGVTAIAASTTGAKILHLTASKDLNARLAVTFADGSGVILAEQTQEISLKASGEVVPVPPTPGKPDDGNKPTQPNTPSENGAGNDADKETNNSDGNKHDANGLLSNTGITVASVVGIAALLAVAGWSLMRTRGKHSHNAKRGE